MPIVETIISAIQSSDYDTIRSSAHSIKGSAGNLKI
ncbi:MAG: Hpt domain-containing protein [Sulfurimonas sp.]|nr:Hpt domain-containing protein [Sulfurimonas sp.]